MGGSIMGACGGRLGIDPAALLPSARSVTQLGGALKAARRVSIAAHTSRDSRREEAQLGRVYRGREGAPERSEAMAKEFRVSLLIRKRPLDQPVHFKEDGGRFDQPKTVKLNVNTKYSMEFTFRPPHILE
jgi:hypothetical protein